MTAAPLKNREIVVGVTGSIAAYKAADIVRRFQDAGAQVTCVLTPTATQFITPLTLAALSGRPAYQDMFEKNLWEMAHLTLSKKAAAVVVAPCSANFLSALAAGRADSLLASLVLVTRSPVFLAPAMHEPMWTHAATRKNAEVCRSYGYRFIGPVKGPMASGQGMGRMEDPIQIVKTVAAALSRRAG